MAARRLRMLRPRIQEAGPRSEGSSSHGWAPDSVRGNRHQRGYGKEWEKTRIRILERDSYLCQPCMRKDRVTPANQVDHIKQKADGGSDEDNNLESICPPCHRTKTARESGGGR